MTVGYGWKLLEEELIIPTMLFKHLKFAHDQVVTFNQLFSSKVGNFDVSKEQLSYLVNSIHDTCVLRKIG